MVKIKINIELIELKISWDEIKLIVQITNEIREYENNFFLLFISAYLKINKSRIKLMKKFFENKYSCKWISIKTKIDEYIETYNPLYLILILFKKNELIIVKIKKTLSIKIKSFCIEKKHNIKIKNALRLVL